MASEYKKLYPNNETITLDGGMDSKFEPALIPDNESPDCLNVDLYDGAAGTRQGGVLLNTMAAGALSSTASAGYAFDGIYTRRANDASETMVAFIRGSMYGLNATTFVTVPSAQSIFTMGNRVGADTAENYLFIGNGGVMPYKWDGTYFTQHGVSAPVSAVTVNSSTTLGTGALAASGIYLYKVTMVNTALVESDLGPISSTFVVSDVGRAAYVTNIPIATFPSQGVNARRLYRTANGGSVYKRVTTLSDNTTTVYQDATADSSLGTTAPSDNGLPPRYNAIIYHRNILFVNDPTNQNYVWYSTIGQPYTFPSTNFFKVGDKTSDLVVGFASYDNYIVVFCENSTWINYMPDPTDATTWRQIKTNSPYGSKSPYCSIQANVRGQDVLLHAAVQNKKFVGFGALMGTTLDPSVSLQPVTSAGSDLQSQVIEPDMFLVQSSYLKNISGIAYKNRAFIAVTYGTNNTTNNRVYVWDYSISNVKKEQLASWVPWTGTPMNIQQFTVYSGKLYGCSSGTDGYVYQIGDTAVYNDNGSAIDSYLWTKEFPGFPEDTALTKDFRFLNALVDNSGSYYMNIRYRADSNAGIGSLTQAYLGTSAAQWDVAIWDVDLWSDTISQTELRVFLGQLRGKRVQFRFDNQNTINQRFKVHRIQFAYNIKGYR